MDFKRMWMNLKEKVEKEGEERDFYFIDTLLSNMEASEQLEAGGKKLPVNKLHRDVICDYDVAWGTLKGRIEELQSPGASVDIVDLLELMDDIEYSQLKMLFDEEDIEQEATE